MPCGSRCGRGPRAGRPCCCATASARAWSCSSRSSTRSIRGGESSGSTCRASAARPPRSLPYHLGTSAPLLAGLLDQLGYQQADVLGISWGGGLAQQFALSRPDRVRRLVLVATGPGALMVPGHPRVLLRMLTPRRHRDPGHAARIAGELYGGSARKNPVVARDLLHATTRLGPARGYYYQLISSLGWTSLPRLPRLRPPTLILAGDDDPIIPLVNARIMHRLIPHSRAARLPRRPPRAGRRRRTHRPGRGGVSRCRPHHTGSQAMKGSQR